MLRDQRRRPPHLAAHAHDGRRVLPADHGGARRAGNACAHLAHAGRDCESASLLRTTRRTRRTIPEYAQRFWRVLLQSTRVFTIFRARFTGQGEPRSSLLGSARSGLHALLRPPCARASQHARPARSRDARCVFARSEQLRILARRARNHSSDSFTAMPILSRPATAQYPDRARRSSFRHCNLASSSCLMKPCASPPIPTPPCSSSCRAPTTPRPTAPAGTASARTDIIDARPLAGPGIGSQARGRQADNTNS